MAANMMITIPILHVSDMKNALAFYVDRLGFTKQWEYRPHQDRDNPVYAGIFRDRAWLHLSSFSGDGVAGNAVVILVEDVDAIHRESTERDVPIQMAPCDQTWGNREMYIEDPDGNSLRFTQENAVENEASG